MIILPDNAIFININIICICLGNPYPCLRLNRRPQVPFFFEKKARLFWKGVLWGSQALFTAEQAAAGAFSSTNRHVFLKKDVSWSFFAVCLSIFAQYLVNLGQYWQEAKGDRQYIYNIYKHIHIYMCIYIYICYTHIYI